MSNNDFLIKTLEFFNKFNEKRSTLEDKLSLFDANLLSMIKNLGQLKPLISSSKFDKGRTELINDIFFLIRSRVDILEKSGRDVKTAYEDVPFSEVSALDEERIESGIEGDERDVAESMLTDLEHDKEKIYSAFKRTQDFIPLMEKVKDNFCRDVQKVISDPSSIDGLKSELLDVHDSLSKRNEILLRSGNKERKLARLMNKMMELRIKNQ